MKKLSILIPYTQDRKSMLEDLIVDLWLSCSPKNIDDVEILTDYREKPVSIGAKRNSLLERANGEYLAFFDSDDKPCNDYIDLLLKAIESNPDCCSLKGIITIDGGKPEIFEHALKYNAWKTNENAKEGEVKYERYPNHLNTIKAYIAKQFKFPEKNFGEDHAYSKLLHASGLLKTEAYISDILYYYKFISKK